ncbi:E3 ubiquitin-protein ligase listerin [Ceratobasidium sp. AG-Ba]|nr:E3 ubiquitin-protein ligase listerin [Ceratobasidium sp. AG-Ba]
MMSCHVSLESEPLALASDTYSAMSSKEEKPPTRPLGSFVFGNPNANGYERDLSTDKIGEELSPEASIWKIYLNEADEYDQELVQGWNSNLDMLLLFAALFSAVVTAFLVEATKLLQQDPADVSMGLLLSIAQSQQRMELGRSIPPDSESPTVPGFAPSAAARWINGFWFISLSLSLIASAHKSHSRAQPSS